MANHVKVAVRCTGVVLPLVLLALPVGACARQVIERVPVVGLPCEGCEAVFVDLPSSLTAIVQIASEEESGERMVIRGVVFDLDGRPAAGVIVYAYHTNQEGIYPGVARLRAMEAFRHGRLRGWAQTDGDGRYEFQTIRPGSYPSRDTPEHVHMHIIEVRCCTYYLSSIHFTDDPLLTGADREEATGGRGGNSLVTPRRDEDGIWIVTRDIHLGQGVPGYPGGSRQAP